MQAITSTRSLEGTTPSVFMDELTRPRAKQYLVVVLLLAQNNYQP